MNEWSLFGLHVHCWCLDFMIQYPWQCGMLRAFHRVSFMNTPCPLHRSPRCLFIADGWHSTHMVRPLIVNTRPQSSFSNPQDFLVLVSSNLAQYLWKIKKTTYEGKIICEDETLLLFIDTDVTKSLWNFSFFSWLLNPSINDHYWTCSKQSK